jgi:putative hemolysin
MNLIPYQDIDRKAAMVQVPSLIKAYLRLGGRVGQGAFIDHTFNTTDVCMVLNTQTMTMKQRQLYER